MVANRLAFWPSGVGTRCALDAMLSQIVLDEADERDVAFVAGRVEGDEARKQLLGGVRWAASWILFSSAALRVRAVEREGGNGHIEQLAGSRSSSGSCRP